MKLFFKILGVPKPKQSVNTRLIKTANGKFISRHYKKEEVAKYETNIAWDIKTQLPEEFIPFTKPIMVNKLLYVFPIPKTFSKKKIKEIEEGVTFYKYTKPDLTDNLNKPLFDAMEGIVYQNDSLIVKIKESEKIYGLIPRIEVELEEIEE